MTSARDAHRRDFLKTAALAAGAAVLAPVASPLATAPAPAAEPIGRPFGPKMRLSLAAYSFNAVLPKNPTEADLSAAAMKLEDFIDYCAELGLEGTELTGYYVPRFVQETPIHRVPENVAATDPAERQARIDAAVGYLVSLKNRAFRLGLSVSGTAIGNDFCLPAGPAWAAQINLCKDWVDRAAAMGAPVIRIFAGKVPQGESEEAAVERCVAAIDECVQYAARRGVCLALENHGGVGGIAAVPETMLKIVRAVKPSPWFGVNLDSGNFKTDDPYRDLALIAPYAVNAQVKAAIWAGGKKEPADLKRVVDILKAADYRGFVVLEYEEPQDPKVEIPKYIDQLRELIG